jgi:predicted membrane-bound mannosyltransferase
MKENKTWRAGYLLILGVIFVVGAGLRLEQLSSQILLNDEWHSLFAVIVNKNYVNLITRFNPNDNSCLQFNLYDLALYRSWGWSEITLRLPVILTGLASLVILPVLVEKMFKERVSIIFAGLLAISPVLIFYSRYVRSYGLAALLCFSALLLCHQWLTTGKPRYLTGYVLTGALAIYAHLLSGVAVFMPLLLAIGLGLGGRFIHISPASRQIVVSVRTLLMVICVLTALLLPLLWPVFLQSVNLPWDRGGMTLNGVITAAGLLAGTVNGPLNHSIFPVVDRWLHFALPA